MKQLLVLTMLSLFLCMGIPQAYCQDGGVKLTPATPGQQPPTQEGDEEANAYDILPFNWKWEDDAHRQVRVRIAWAWDFGWKNDDPLPEDQRLYYLGGVGKWPNERDAWEKMLQPVRVTDRFVEFVFNPRDHQCRWMNLVVKDKNSNRFWYNLAVQEAPYYDKHGAYWPRFDQEPLEPWQEL